MLCAHTWQKKHRRTHTHTHLRVRFVIFNAEWLLHACEYHFAQCCLFTLFLLHILYCAVRLSYHHTANLSYCCRYCCIDVYSFRVMFCIHFQIYAYAHTHIHTRAARSRVKSKRCRQTHAKYWMVAADTSKHHIIVLYIVLTTLSTTNAYPRSSYFVYILCASNAQSLY